MVLTLQQFTVNMSGLWHNAVYAPSLDLEPKAGMDLLKCEIDFAWLIPRHYPEKTVVVIGECKDRGSQIEDGKDTGTVDEKDIDHLRRIADALPQKRFNTFIVLAKLCPYTADEIALAKTLNEKYRRRVILLTARELEPHHFYERTKLEYQSINEYASTPRLWPIQRRRCTLRSKCPITLTNIWKYASARDEKYYKSTTVLHFGAL